VLQDAKELMSQVRDLKFALEESDQAAEHLAAELAAAQVVMLCPSHMPFSPSANTLILHKAPHASHLTMYTVLHTDITER
jgi:hypothetical protein